MNQLTDGDTRLVNVWGPPGFGKTSVAINVAQQLKDMEIPVYFASLRGMKRKDDLVSKLLGIFVDAKQAFYNSPSQWLIQNLQRVKDSFVLILDNADDLLESGDVELKEEVLRFLEEILDQCNHIKLLITTRESLDYWSHKLSIHLERVGVLDEISSHDLVKFLLPDLSEIDRNSLVQVCGQVPLSMRLTCTVVTEENISAFQLLDVLKTSPLFEVLDDESFSNDSRLKVIIDTCFARLAKQDRDAFVSLGVFPASFGIDEAKNVLNLKTDQQTKKRLRSLKRKSLIECGDDFESCMIHSLFRSFVEERSKTDQQTRAVFTKAKHFYTLYNFDTANERYLTGHSNEALAAFRNDPESIILSLVNGATDDELYVKVVKVLSEGELLLFTALSHEEWLFNFIYDAALEEALKRRNVVDYKLLLAAKSFGYWGWFSSDPQALDISMEGDFTNAAECPAKLQCYYGIHQILCDKLEEGMSSLESSVDRLTKNRDEKVLKLLVYEVLAGCHQRNQEHEMASHYENLCSSESTTTFISEGMRLMVNGAFLYLKTKLIGLTNGKNAPPFAGRVFKAQVAFMAVFGRCLNSHGQLDLINILREFEKLLKLGDYRMPNWPYVGLALNLFSLGLRSVDFDQLLPSSLGAMETYDFAKRLIETDLEVYQRLTNSSHDAVYDAVARMLIFSPAVVGLRRKMFENAFKSYEEVPGADFYDLARSYDKLGTLLFLMDDYSGAEGLFQQDLRLMEEDNGEAVETASTLTNLVRAYFKKTNNKAEAEKAFENALKLRKRLGVYDHVDTANI